MIRKFYLWLRKNLLGIDDRSQLEIAIENGLIMGENVSIQPEVILDPSHCWLISIGNNVTIAPRVYILCHDASTKRITGYTRIGKVTIGDNVFIGANSTVLPGCTIGNNVIIGANSVVTRSIPDNCVAAGNPCRIIKDYKTFSDDAMELLRSVPCFDNNYIIGRIDDKKKQEMKTKLETGCGYIR